MCKRNINLPVLFMITFSGYNAFTVCIIPSPLNPKAFPGRIPERNTCSLYMNNTCKYTVVLVSFSKYRTICLVKFALLNRETRLLHNYKPTCKAQCWYHCLFINPLYLGQRPWAFSMFYTQQKAIIFAFIMLSSNLILLSLHFFRLVPVGLVVRIRRSHRRGRGSIPRQGAHFFLYLIFRRPG